MSREIPEGHPLRTLFRRATRKALGSDPSLDAPGVARHISEEILAEFIHMDRIYKLRNAGGRRLSELAEMIVEGKQIEGLERELEVQQHIGDYALFMTGLFPEGIGRRKQQDPYVARVGSILVTFRRPLDYYVAEGRTAYGRVSEMWSRLDRQRSATFHKLGDAFERYMGVMTLIRTYLKSDPYFRRVEGVIY